MQQFLDLARKKTDIPPKVKEEKENVDKLTECQPVHDFDPFTTLDPDTCIVTFVRHPFGTYVLLPTRIEYDGEANAVTGCNSHTMLRVHA